MYREEEEEGDAEQDLLLEKDIAAQRLWQAFQESATAVAHLFRGTHKMYTIYIYTCIYIYIYIYILYMSFGVVVSN